MPTCCGLLWPRSPDDVNKPWFYWPYGENHAGMGYRHGATAWTFGWIVRGQQYVKICNLEPKNSSKEA